MLFDDVEPRFEESFRVGEKSERRRARGEEKVGEKRKGRIARQVE